MHTATLHADTSSHGIDTVVVALHGHLGSLSRHAGHAADGDETVRDFGHFGLKESFEEHGAGTAENDPGVVVLVVYPEYDCPDGLTLAVVVVGNLLALGQVKFVALVINEEHLTLPGLVYLTTDHLAHLLLVFVVERVMLQFENLGGECLPEVQDGAASELPEVHILTHFLADFIVGSDLLCIGQ